MGQFFSWRTAVLKSGLPATTRHVLLTLACHMNDAGESCYPSIALLVEETGLSKQTVITHLDKAESEGWIAVEQHGFRGQKWKRNEYKMAWPDNAEGGQPVRPPYEEGGQPNHKKVVKEVDPSTSLSTSKNRCHDQTVSAPDPDPIAHDPVNFDGVRWQVDEAVFDQWIESYANGRTHLDTEDWIEAELSKASVWLQANPRKRKKNYMRFLSGWLTRAAERIRSRGQ